MYLRVVAINVKNDWIGVHVQFYIQCFWKRNLTQEKMQSRNFSLQYYVASMQLESIKGSKVHSSRGEGCTNKIRVAHFQRKLCIHQNMTISQYDICHITKVATIVWIVHERSEFISLKVCSRLKSLGFPTLEKQLLWNRNCRKQETTFQARRRRQYSFKICLTLLERPICSCITLLLELSYFDMLLCWWWD